ncbi:C40 family peptidase [Actinomycetospora endophytica]|uniref:C40 family peptidase n=1 Tax=Actinomycetospora endophytica TaxID=2291215 RepID=A0ABS8PJB9_9PSEU|nr:C40 family peptidase [Actinomycetospora endophytica]MCD2197094.1 C40 family peptidase [Actinomycetospora endophytica]
MTAVLPSARPVPAGRHRAPDAATTGSLGPIPQEWTGRAAHGGDAADPRQQRDPRAQQRDPRTGPAPLNRAARTAGLSLAALGALAGAGGAAAHGLIPGDQPAQTGETAIPTNLAASNMSLQGASHQVAAPAVTTVMPVVPAASTVQAPQYKTVAATARQAPAAAPAAKPAADEPSSAAADALDAAESKLGKPYVWGATGPNSFDCSGLMQYAFEQAGQDLPRTAAAQSKVGDKVSMDDLKPGDLIFLYSPVSHVVMYVGNGKVIEAPNSGEDVKFTPLSKIEKNVVGARRVA